MEVVTAMTVQYQDEPTHAWMFLPSQEGEYEILPEGHWAWLILIPHPTTNKPVSVAVDALAVLELADLAKRAGVEIAFRVFRLGIIMNEGWSPEGVRQMRHVFDELLRFVEQQNIENVLEEVLQITYGMLHDKTVTRRQAAEWASRMLGRRVSSDTWRKSVDAWAKRKGYPKIDLPTGRPRKKKSEDRR